MFNKIDIDVLIELLKTYKVKTEDKNDIDSNLKYKLDKTDSIKAFDGTTNLYRLIALKDFSDVKKGEKGGYVESEDNLSQTGNCWVYGKAWVWEDAEVYDDARIYGAARISGDAEVFDNAMIFNDTRVALWAKVFGNAWVSGDSEVSNARVFGNARIWDSGVYNNARISGDSEVTNARITGDALWVYEGDQ